MQSDHLAKSIDVQPDASRHSLSAMVEAVGSDPCHLTLSGRLTPTATRLRSCAWNVAGCQVLFHWPDALLLSFSYFFLR
jgi:hypothetical protein